MEKLKQIKKYFGKLPVPGWLYAIAVVLYCEALLHIWITDEISLPRFAAVLAFALGFGGVLAQIVSFIGHKTWGKWVTVAVTGIVAAFYLVEFFVSDAYMIFMTVTTLLSGAKGVATDFGDVVIQVVIRDFWRILLVMLPVILYAVFAAPVKTSWRMRWFGLVIALAAYFLGYQIVTTVGTDAARLDNAYNFDSAIRVFGLNMGMTLDVIHGSGEGEEEKGEFVIVETPPAAPVQTPEPEEAVPQETEPVVYGDNVMAFDFAAMAEAETNSRIASIHNYVNSVDPSSQNQYTGLFKGKNLIIIAAESFAKEVIDPELTPTLYRLANEGIRFDDYYQPMWGGSTSSGEFSILTSLVSASGTESIKEGRKQDLFLSIGKQLQKEGYHSAAYHNHLYTFYERHQTHIHYGYDSFMGMNNGMEKGVTEQWPESDLEMMDYTVPLYIDKQPFSVYYMTVSGHARYTTAGNKMSKKNYDAVKDLDCSETLKGYYACQLELEYALESLVRQLEEAGIADDTVIVLSTDHYPYALEKSSTWDNKEDYIAEMYGYVPQNDMERTHSALIIWSGAIEDMDIVVEEPTYALDILPTLSNLFGVEFDSRLLVGRDVFSDAEPIVLWYDHSWRTDKGYYDASRDEFTPFEGVEVDESYVERISNIVSNKMYYSYEVQRTRYFNYVAKELAKTAVAE